MSIKIPSTVIEIGNRAFSGCEKFREMLLHEGITNIRLDAFRYCKFSTISSRFGAIAGHWTELNNKVNEIC